MLSEDLEHALVRNCFFALFRLALTLSAAFGIAGVVGDGDIPRKRAGEDGGADCFGVLETSVLPTFFN